MLSPMWFIANSPTERISTLQKNFITDYSAETEIYIFVYSATKIKHALN